MRHACNLQRLLKASWFKSKLTEQRLDAEFVELKFRSKAGHPYLRAQLFTPAICSGAGMASQDEVAMAEQTLRNSASLIHAADEFTLYGRSRAT